MRGLFFRNKVRGFYRRGTGVINFAKRQGFYSLKTSLLMALVLTVAVGGFLVSNKANAETTFTPPDACFAFSAGTITDYYNNEGNNSANPACPRAINIPGSIGGVAVIGIGSWAFSNNQLTSITIPSSVTSIGDYAFYSNRLTSVIISSSVTSIGSSAFQSNQLTSVTIPSSVNSIGNQAFYDNQLTSVTIPSSVTSIGSSVFSYNQLTSVIIPSSVTSIGDYAFYNNQLTSVTIPSSVTSIGNQAFYDNQLTSVTIPGSVTSIQHDTFANNPITSMTIDGNTYTPQTPTTSSACFSMSGTTVNDYYVFSPVVAMSSGVLCGTDITIPNSVTSIGSWTFYDDELTSVTIPSSVTSIGNYAFSFNKINSVTIPSSITSINMRDFFAQNPLSGDIDDSTNLNNLSSNDPEVVQRIYDSIWYAQIYTHDPSNPGGLKDTIMSEDRWQGDDANANGTVRDSLGGAVINPAQVTLRYVDNQGNQLQQPTQLTGIKTDGTSLTNYSVTASAILAPLDPDNPTPEETAELEAGFAQYYRGGQTKSFTAPNIAGYSTPTAKTVTLQPGENVVTFTYAKQIVSTPSVPTTSTPKKTSKTYTPASLTEDTTPSDDTANTPPLAESLTTVDFSETTQESLLQPSVTEAPATLAPIVAKSTLATDTTKSCSRIQSASLLEASTLTAPTKDYQTIGGLQFKLSCATVGGDAKVNFTLGDTLKDTTTARIYKKNATGETTDITNEVTLTNVNTEDGPKTKISYTLQDGQKFDDDGIADGVITDPIYITVPVADIGSYAATTSNNLSNTENDTTTGSSKEQGLNWSGIMLWVAAVLLASGIIWWLITKTKKHQ